VSNPSGKKSILVVDDDPRSVRLMNIVLGHAGYLVHSASDAEEGLVVLGRERPDLVLVDLLMPGTDGIGFCERARQMPALGALRLVLFTAMANSETRRRALGSGADDVFVKPFERQQLLQRLDELLASSEGDAGASESVSGESATTR
jgi:CheY-like chemotaxis protein